MAKVLQLTSCHGPHDVRIFMKTARSLANAGYQVVLLAPNAEEGTRDGVTFKGFKASGGRLRRFLIRPFKIFWRALGEKPDLVHFHDPDLLPVGVALRLCGCRVVYDVHEDYSATVYDRPWIPWLAKPLLALPLIAVEQLCVRLFSATIAATPTIAERFPAAKTIVINNYPLAMELVNSASAVPWGQRRSFVYVGGISRERGIAELMEAMAIFRRDYPHKLELAGVIPDPDLRSAVETIASREDWLSYHGVVDRAGVSELLGRALVGLVTLLPVRNHVDSQPVKLYEYMSAGLPVIASAFPSWQKLIETHRCGLCVNPAEPKEIVHALRYLVEHPDEAEAMGQRGQRLVRERLNWSGEEKKLLALYDELLGRADRNAHTVQP